jgi:hypothetical protein
MGGGGMGGMGMGGGMMGGGMMNVADQPSDEFNNDTIKNRKKKM